MTYLDLWLALTAWKREFRASEFRAAFPSPDPEKVLHDMARLGFLERIGWGRYRVRSLDELKRHRFNIPKAYEFLKSSSLEYALTGPDAVLLWTKGGYDVGRFIGFYPIHIKVLKDELGKWKAVIRKEGYRHVVMGKEMAETLYGVFFVLYPGERLSYVELEGLKVIPLDETVNFCLKNIYSYQPALELLDEMYNLKLEVRYRERHGL